MGSTATEALDQSQLTAEGPDQTIPTKPTGMAIPSKSAMVSGFPRPWMNERARRLQRICRCLERRVQRGKELRLGVRWFAWYWQGRRYKSAPARPVRLSRASLIRAYYRWRNAGRTAEAFTLRYRSARPKISVAAVTELAGHALLADVTSFEAAFRKLAQPAGTASAYRYAMGAELRAGFGQLFSARRKVLAAERQVRQLLTDFQAKNASKR